LATPNASAFAKITVPDRVGVVHDLSSVIAAERLKIRALGTSKDEFKVKHSRQATRDVATVWFTMEHPNPDQWDRIEKRLM
jgi:hypothetical protein